MKPPPPLIPPPLRKPPLLEPESERVLELEPDQKLERESELLELLDPQSNRPPEEAVLERRGRLLAVANSEVMIGSATLRAGAR